MTYRIFSGEESMKKIVSKFALAAAVAALALAGSAGDSVAKGKKAAPAACMPGALKTAACGPAGCTMVRCWADGKWHPSLFACWQPWCPK
jgi:hypothetical protein